MIFRCCTFCGARVKGIIWNTGDRCPTCGKDNALGSIRNEGPTVEAAEAEGTAKKGAGDETPTPQAQRKRGGTDGGSRLSAPADTYRKLREALDALIDLEDTNFAAEACADDLREKMEPVWYTMTEEEREAAQAAGATKVPTPSSLDDICPHCKAPRSEGLCEYGPGTPCHVAEPRATHCPACNDLLAEDDGLYCPPCLKTLSKTLTGPPAEETSPRDTFTPKPGQTFTPTSLSAAEIRIAAAHPEGAKKREDGSDPDSLPDNPIRWMLMVEEQKDGAWEATGWGVPLIEMTSEEGTADCGGEDRGAAYIAALQSVALTRDGQGFMLPDGANYTEAMTWRELAREVVEGYAQWREESSLGLGRLGEACEALGAFTPDAIRVPVRDKTEGEDGPVVGEAVVSADGMATIVLDDSPEAAAIRNRLKGSGVGISSKGEAALLKGLLGEAAAVRSAEAAGTNEDGCTIGAWCAEHGSDPAPDGDELEDDADAEEPTPTYLRGLAERLRSIPVAFEVDGGDISRLEDIAAEVEAPKPPGGTRPAADAIEENVRTLGNALSTISHTMLEAIEALYALGGNLKEQRGAEGTGEKREGGSEPPAPTAPHAAKLSALRVEIARVQADAPDANEFLVWVACESGLVEALDAAIATMGTEA